MFLGSTKQLLQRQKFWLLCYILLSLALKSGSLLLNSYPVSWQKVCVRVCWQGGLQPWWIWNVKVMYDSQYFWKYTSHLMFVTVQWNYHSLNSFRMKTMTHREIFTMKKWIWTHLWYWFRWVIMKSESFENEEYCKCKMKTDQEVGTVVSGWTDMSIRLQAVKTWKKWNEALHTYIIILSPLSIFMLYFTSVIDLLVKETNRFYHQYLDRHDRKPNPLLDVMNSEIFPFQAIIAWMGHNICERLRNHWTRAEQFFTPFYLYTMTHYHFLHILHYLRFTGNYKEINKNDVMTFMTDCGK